MNKILLILMIVVFFQCNDKFVFGQPNESYSTTKQLLSTIGGLKKENLKILFQTGDKRIEDLIKALDDPNEDIRLNAQTVIRYLGNKKGMNALLKLYTLSPKDFPFTGPIPLPIHELDYKLIDARCPMDVKEKCKLSLHYIFALALDNSDKANTILSKLNQNIINGEKLFTVPKPSSLSFLIKDNEELAITTLRNTFFLSDNDKNLSTARLVTFNEHKDKALIRIYVDRGALAEEWYYVVVKKEESYWKFFSVFLEAVS